MMNTPTVSAPPPSRKDRESREHAHERSVRSRSTAADWIAAIALPLVLMAGLTMLGANSLLLGCLFAAMCFASATITVWALAPSPAVWRDIALVGVPIAIALAWTALPEAIGGLRPPATRLAPGAAWPSWLALAGTAFCVVPGAAIGASRRLATSAVDVLLALALIWLVAALALYAVDPVHVFGYDKGLAGRRFTATLLNANTAGCVGVMLATLASARLLSLAGRGSRARPAMLALGVALAAASMIVVVLSGSRLAVAFGAIALVALLILASPRGTIPPRWRVAVAGASLLPALVGLAISGRAFGAKLGALGSDAADRWQDLLYYAALSAHAPWFGHGLGSFRALGLQELASSGAVRRWNYGAAHNAVLQAAIEGGWPYALLGCASVIAAGCLLWSRRRVIRADPVALGATLAVAAALVFGLLDIALNVPAVAALAWWLGGVALGRSLSASAHLPRRRRRGARRSGSTPASAPASP